MLNIKERELIIKLHRKGEKQERIADLIGCSQPTVHRWIQNSKKKRTLNTLPRSGRPTSLTPNTLSRLKEKLRKFIYAANEEYGAVSTKEVADIIRKEIGESYSLRHVERILHKLGFSLITPRSEHIRHDQKKVDAFRNQFKKKSSRSMWVMS
jgi:transposase